MQAKTSEEPAQTVEPHAFSDTVAEGNRVDPPRVALCYSLSLSWIVPQDAVTIILGFRLDMLVMVIFNQYGPRPDRRHWGEPES